VSITDNMKDWFAGENGGGGSKGSTGSTKELTSHSTVGLTALGSAKVDNNSLQKQMYEIGATLKDEGASSLAEIGQETHIPVFKLKHIIKAMILRGYVRKVGADGE